MEKLIRIGMDTSKSVFQVHGVNAAEQMVLKRQLRRREVVAFFAKLEPTLVAIEACGGSHYWARTLSELGHEVKLLAPQHVKPYVKRGKHDAADAAALCEAVSRPGMTFVSAKSPAEQSALMLVGMRDRLIRTRTQLSNAIRSYASEFGIVAAKGLDKVAWLLDQVASDGNLPLEAKALFELQGQEYDRLQAEIRAVEARLLAWHRGNADSRKLVEVPGIGPLGASRLAMKKADAAGCRSARHFSAWLGLTAKNHSTAGRLRLGGITRAGDPLLRSVLVVGAMAVIRQAGHHPEKASPWLLALLKRKPKKLAAVALANKNARIAWKMMMTGECYDATRALKPIAKAA